MKGWFGNLVSEKKQKTLLVELSLVKNEKGSYEFKAEWGDEPFIPNKVYVQGIEWLLEHFVENKSEEKKK